MSLHLDWRVGEELRIGGAVISLIDKTGKTARIRIEAPREIAIDLIKSQPVVDSKSRPVSLHPAHECSTVEVITHGSDNRRAQRP
jgi:hypothetical protein